MDINMQSFLTQNGFEYFGVCNYLKKTFYNNVLCGGFQSHFCCLFPVYQWVAHGACGFRGDVRE